MEIQVKRIFDIGINVMLPMMAGGIFYLTAIETNTPIFLKNHLADGLWAYSLLSSILVLFNRQIKRAWVISIFVIVALFEILQSTHFIPGTGDWVDILTYYIFLILALLVNTHFREYIKQRT